MPTVGDEPSPLVMLGTHQVYGYSQSFDLIEACKTTLGNDLSGHSDLNILLICPGDIRHVLKTIAQRRRHIHAVTGEVPKVNIYIMEKPVDIIARDLVLLELAFDWELPIRYRANTFLEVFGNSKIQTRTATYLEQLARQLRAFVTESHVGSNDKDCRIASLVDLSHLLYRERDVIESTFRSYVKDTSLSTATDIQDIDSYRDYRLRSYLGARYDNRKSMSDWDWHQTFKHGASIVHSKLYKDWRFTGIAFEVSDSIHMTLLKHTCHACIDPSVAD